jgi:O-acetyl-ADP-ribose deacetylase (regulator of RNase III)
LDLDEYRELVRLDEPFVPPEPAPEANAARSQLIDRLLEYLVAEGIAVLGGVPGPPPKVAQEGKRLQLRALLTVRAPEPLPDWFHRSLDSLLQREALDRGFVDPSSLSPVSETVPGASFGPADRCILWRGDITTLRVDAVVNAANSSLLGCFQPYHGCIDNAIHSAAGPRVREDCHRIVTRQGHPEATGLAKVTRGYNLPAGFVVHTVGPVYSGDPYSVPHAMEEALASSYRSCLELAGRVPRIRSIAFSCIATGEFGFPAGPAARIALGTVEGWMTENPDSLDAVVFDTYRSEDLGIYQRLLSRGC